jgi:hypothetical protein
MGISPENGVTSSKIRKSAPDAKIAQTRNDAMTTGLGATKGAEQRCAENARKCNQ